MATYSSPNYTKNYPKPYHGMANNINALLDATISPSAAMTTADVLNFGYIPPNAVITGAILKCSDMDTNGSPTLTLDVGITGTAQLFFAASTAGQTGTTDSTMAAAGRLYKNTTGANLLIVGAPHANAATGVAGTIQLVLLGYIDDPKTT